MWECKCIHVLCAPLNHLLRTGSSWEVVVCGVQVEPQSESSLSLYISRRLPARFNRRQRTPDILLTFNNSTVIINQSSYVYTKICEITKLNFVTNYYINIFTLLCYFNWWFANSLAVANLPVSANRQCRRIAGVGKSLVSANRQNFLFSREEEQEKKPQNSDSWPEQCPSFLSLTLGLNLVWCLWLTTG